MSVAPQPNRHKAARRVRTAVDLFLANNPNDLPALYHHNHQIDAHAQNVLARLGGLGCNSDRITAAEAIVHAIPEAAWGAFFADCIIAEWKARSHKQWISDAQSTADRSIEADKAIDLVARFLGSPRHDPIDEALGLLRDQITTKRRSATEHLELYSRKTTAEAARALGAGWIRETMERIARRYGSPPPEPRHVAAIAGATLALGHVTPEAARKAPSFAGRLRALRSGAFGGQKSTRTRRIGR